jgi:hypothetical protein
MLQELAARTAAGHWAVASMLFFLAVWMVIAIRTVRARAEDMDAQAHLALEGEGAGSTEIPSGPRRDA